MTARTSRFSTTPLYSTNPNPNRLQLFYTEYYLKNSKDVTLDYDCHIFQCLHGAFSHVAVDRASHRVVNTVRHSRPCVLHGNGPEHVKVFLNRLCDHIQPSRARQAVGAATDSPVPAVALAASTAGSPPHAPQPAASTLLLAVRVTAQGTCWASLRRLSFPPADICLVLYSGAGEHLPDSHAQQVIALTASGRYRSVTERRLALGDAFVGCALEALEACSDATHGCFLDGSAEVHVFEVVVVAYIFGWWPVAPNTDITATSLLRPHNSQVQHDATVQHLLQRTAALDAAVVGAVCAPSTSTTSSSVSANFWGQIDQHASPVVAFDEQHIISYTVSGAWNVPSCRSGSVR
jgi:hypothetical protein